MLTEHRNSCFHKLPDLFFLLLSSLVGFFSYVQRLSLQQSFLWHHKCQDPLLFVCARYHVSICVILSVLPFLSILLKYNLKSEYKLKLAVRYLLAH